MLPQDRRTGAGRSSRSSLRSHKDERIIVDTKVFAHEAGWRIATQSEVLEHYAAGGHTIVDGPNAGVDSANPFKSSFIRGFELTDEERADVLAFLDYQRCSWAKALAQGRPWQPERGGSMSREV